MAAPESGTAGGRLERGGPMEASNRWQLVLEDLLGDLRYARTRGDLGRLALLAYCEVRRWARMVGEQPLADRSARLVTGSPHASRAEFLAAVDDLIAELERFHARLPGR